MFAEKLFVATLQIKLVALKILNVILFKDKKIGFFYNELCLKIRTKEESCEKMDGLRCIDKFGCI